MNLNSMMGMGGPEGMRRMGGVSGMRGMGGPNNLSPGEENI